MTQAQLAKAIKAAEDNDNRLKKASRLIAFGWEYWGFDTLVFAARLVNELGNIRDANNVSDRTFHIWLSEQIRLWDEHWGEASEGSGPLKKPPFGQPMQPTSIKPKNSRKVG